MIVPGKHARKPVWVQVQQRDRRHDLRAEADTGEKQRTEHAALIDLTEAFDTVSRDGLWKILVRLGCLPQISHHPPPAP